MRALTVLVTAAGAPGTAALLRALRENRDGEVRLVGCDMNERVVGRFLCDAFETVPPGSDDGFAGAVLDLCRREGADVVLPQSSHDLQGLADGKGDFERAGVAVLVSGPETVRTANDKAECYTRLSELGVPVPVFRQVRGRAAFAAAAHEWVEPSSWSWSSPKAASGP